MDLQSTLNAISTFQEAVIPAGSHALYQNEPIAIYVARRRLRSALRTAITLTSPGHKNGGDNAMTRSYMRTIYGCLAQLADVIDEGLTFVDDEALHEAWRIIKVKSVEDGGEL